jgi:hypothetical protein
MANGIVRLLVVGAAAMAAPSAALAQVGSGWTRYNPSSTIQLDGSDGIESSPGSTTNKKNEGASYSNSGGIETFSLFDPISNRCERRMRNEYTSGRWQFEGEVRVSAPTNNESIMQVFGGTSGATTQMIRAYNSGGGTIKKVPGSVTLATGVHGKWIRINVIHDVGANVVRTYVDGQLKATGDGEAPAKWYHKYGVYGTLKTPTAKVEWRNVKHFRHSDNDENDALDMGELPLAGELPEPELPDFPDEIDPPTPAGTTSDPSLGEVVGFGCSLGGSSGGAGIASFGLAIGAALLLRRRRRAR